MWNILGIAPTSDVKEIKRAYAKLAKQYNPEEHPDEFRMIFDAYKRACDYAKKSTHVPAESIPSENIRTKIGIAVSEPSDPAETEYVFDNMLPVSDYYEIAEYGYGERSAALLGCIKLIVSDKNRKNDPDAWNELLRSAAFESLIFDTEFRQKAADIFFGEMFEYEAAKAVAGGFSYGTRIEHINYYPVHECTVKISINPFAYRHPRQYISYDAQERKIIKLLLSAAVFLALVFCGMIAVFYFLTQ